MKKNGKWGCLFVIVLGVILIVWLLTKSQDSTLGEQSQIEQMKQRMDNELKELQEQQQKHWQISKTIDEMTDKERVVASLTSGNEVYFKFPYDGGSSLKMSIRRWNNDLDVFFTISQGQFTCSEYNGTNTVMIRFDDEEAVKYRVVESATNRSDMLFISSSSSAKKILSKCKEAHTIKVRANFFDEGSRDFVFEPNEPLIGFE